ncbi:MAG TPA: GMP synthase (glutamine-hydrolyzing), partial [Acidimicrobiaceae bacterium]|nr:GMP synthase (glutamine-hydrolyzing) [Acidimicrobiaceae bacterium]
EGFTVTAATNDAPAAVIENNTNRIYGVQYHPEVVHTPHGQKLLETFLTDIAGCNA